ncbi:hypothetical protein K4A83_18015 [Spirulina subsalsa FACHB-351]|uniref:SRPBCC domain-containing protein n=1 Tax=Spirulina subsalsa FACHB-351 TaxID=234711 RepID=A0ABT3L9F9_9CYAN|nr:hypothetical protein [Spirulina subsalsa]MCW6038152.1 hypothetical protein [Spirulina subsalsa FACHB-351]
MFGNFQKSHLRIEVNASAEAIADSLLKPELFRQWLMPQQFERGLPEQLYPDLVFRASLGIVTIEHQVDVVYPNALRLILSQGIDGYHEWYWGEGWVQSRLEGVSLLPLNLGQTFALSRLRDFVTRKERDS